MIRNNTVLILGAGASKPHGFPTGHELFVEICNCYNSYIHQHIIEAGFSSGDVRVFITALTQSGLDSVDVFLEYRMEFADVGKAAIAAVLLPLEGRYLFKVNKNDNWYKYVFGQLVADTHTIEDFG